MISIIIPTYNESLRIPILLEFLTGTLVNKAYEIIVVDGGSTDNTTSIAATFPHTHIIESAKGRSKQLNTGAKKAAGTCLYFLHADCLPPTDFCTTIIKSLENHDAGCFSIQFQPNSLWLSFFAWWSRFDIDAFRFGDQSLFITKDCFRSILGYDNNLELLEGQDIVKRLKKHKYQFIVAPSTITASSRLTTANGAIKEFGIYTCIILLNLLKVKSSKQAAFYRKYMSGGKM